MSGREDYEKIFDCIWHSSGGYKMTADFYREFVQGEVLDHCKEIDLVYHTGRFSEICNIGGRNEQINIQIVDRVCSILDEMIPLPHHSKQPIRYPELDSESNLTSKSYKDLIIFVQNRVGHDRRYAIDTTKLENEYGWKADENFDSGIVKTIEWYLRKYNK